MIKLLIQDTLFLSKPASFTKLRIPSFDIPRILTSEYKTILQMMLLSFPFKQNLPSELLFKSVYTLFRNPGFVYCTLKLKFLDPYPARRGLFLPSILPLNVTEGKKNNLCFQGIEPPSSPLKKVLIDQESHRVEVYLE